MTASRIRNTIGKILNIACAGSFLTAVIMNERLNEDPILGSLVVWATLAFWAMSLFWSTSLPFMPHLREFRFLRIPFGMAVIAVLYAMLQIPIWSLMTGRFPPDHFTPKQAHIATAGVLFGMVGPGAPMGVNFFRNLWVKNRKPRMTK